MPRLRRSVTNLRERLRKASAPNLRRQATDVPVVPPVPDVFSRAPPPPPPQPPAAPVSPPVLPPSAPLPDMRTPERSPHYVRRRHMPPPPPPSPDDRTQSPWSFTAMIRRLSGDDVQSDTYNSKNSLFSSDSTSSAPTSAPSVEYLAESPAAALRTLAPPAKAAAPAPATPPAATPACARASPSAEQPRTTRLRRVPPPVLPL